jgi:probable phosphoglycerate mutase
VTQLLLVRHGETDWNAAGRWQGHSDTPLNDEGRRQALALAATLEDVDVVYASDLARARETAEIVGERLELPVRLDARLRERGFGAWEGLTTAEVERRFPDDHRRWRAGDGFGAADAEPFEAFAARIHAVLEHVLGKHADQTVLLVSHGGSIRVIHALACGLDYVRDHRSIPAVANCSLARYAAKNGKLAPID